MLAAAAGLCVSSSAWTTSSSWRLHHVRARASTAVAAEAWDAWTLQDVGLFDAAILGVGAAGVYFVTTREDATESFDDAAEAEEGAQQSADALRDASVEVADVAAAARQPATDPNELQPWEALKARLGGRKARDS